MEVLGEDQALQAVFGRASDLHGIENEAIDFTQLEDYLNSDTENFNFETFANGSGEDHDHHQHHQHHSHGHGHNQNQNQSHGKIPNSTLPQSNHCNKARQHGEERHLANSHHGEQRHLQQNQHGEERHLPQSQHGEERHLPHSQHSEERHLPHSQHGEERHLPHTEHAEERHLVHTQQHTPDRLSDYSDAMSFKNSVHYAKGSLPESPPESEPYSPPENNGKQSTISSISSTVPPANYSQPSLYEHMKQIFNNGSLNNVPSSQLSPPHSTQQPSPQHSAGLHSPPQTQQPQQQQTQPTHSSPVHNNLQADSVTTSSPSHAQQATQGVGGQPATAQQLLHYMKTTNQLNAAALQQHLHNVIARSTPVMTAPAPLPPPHLNNQSPTASAAVTATTSPQHLASAAGTQTMGFLPICGSPAHTLPVLAPPGVPLAGCAIAASSSSSSLSPQHVAAGGAGGGGVAKQLPPNFGVMNNLQNQPAKKRKYESPNNTVNEKNANSLLNGLLQNIKQEPDMSPLGQPSPDTDDSMFDMYDNGDAVYADGSYQCIKFQPFQPPKWHTLYDASCKELPGPTYRIDADKGFNFSVSDDAFVCQKKNHFQVTSHVGLNGDPKIVKTPDGYKKIDSWQLHFYGVKMKRSQNMDSMTQTIKVEQSQSDRSKRAFHPVPLQLQPGQLSKVTVGRLHFSETTSNNMRKKGKPNPDQRFFLLVVSLNCHCGSSNYQIVAQASERIIVRASNPGQFESDVDVNWQKGSNQDSIWHSGRVGVNTDRPDESLVVHGNLKVTGQVVQPSDMRVKRDIQELDSKNQLQNVTRMKLYKYKYTESFGKVAGLSEDELEDAGVLAQEMRDVLPDAVKETEDLELADGHRVDKFLVVNKDRIFMENVGAVKELCKLTDNLENRIDELEHVHRKLGKLKRVDSIKSNASTATTLSRASTITERKGQRSKPRGRSHGNQPPANTGLCSSRFMQISIVILVSIMAFCLIAMATLYILEWHKRQASMTGPANMTTVQIKFGTGGGVRSTPYPRTPPATPAATTVAVSLLTPIAGHSPLALGPQPCMHSVHACHVSKCCQPTQPHSPLLKPLRIESEHNQTQDTPPLGDPYSRPQENSITKEPPTEPSGGGKKHQWTDDLGSRPRPTGTMMSKESVSPTGRFINPSKVLQPPEISPPHSGIGYNPEMSAGEGGVIITHHQPSNKLQDNLPFEPRPQKIEGAGATALQMSSNDEPQSLPGGATQGAQLPTGPQMPTAQPQEAEEPVVVGTTSASWKKYRRKKYKKFVELRKKRSAESNMASAAVTIEILDYFIVDGSYCLNNECGPYGNYSYYIPISGFMPPIDIFLSINVTTGFDVLLCTELSMTEGASCADTGVHASMQTNAILNSGADVTQHKWLVAAPQYTRSVYTFRVAARNTPAAQLCSDAFRSEVGSAFLQYNLHFYRVCSDIDALSSTTPSSTWP